MRTQTTVEGIERDHGMRFHRELLVETPAGIVEERTSAPASGPMVEPEVRIEPVRWSVISAGVVAALSTTFLLSALAGTVWLVPDGAGAVPHWAFDNLGAVILAGVIGFLSFLFGGWAGSRLAVYRSARTGLLSGALVWGVSIPLLVFTGRGAPNAGARAADMLGPQAVEHFSAVVLSLFVAALVGALLGGLLGSMHTPARPQKVKSVR